ITAGRTGPSWICCGPSSLRKGTSPRRHGDTEFHGETMVSAERARQLLSVHGIVRPQPASDWTGETSLPCCVERFYREVGPVDLTIETHGNPFFIPPAVQVVRLPGRLSLERADR